MRYCECSKNTDRYKSYSGSVRCSGCFLPISPAASKPEKESTIYISEDSDNYCVMMGEKIHESFNKLAEDYAYNLAKQCLERIKRFNRQQEREDERR